MSHPYEELARRLCCAEMSVALGISFQHCMKTYMPKGPVSPYWLQLAKTVSEDCARMREQAAGGKAQEHNDSGFSRN